MSEMLAKEYNRRACDELTAATTIRRALALQDLIKHVHRTGLAHPTVVLPELHASVNPFIETLNGRLRQIVDGNFVAAEDATVVCSLYGVELFVGDFLTSLDVRDTLWARIHQNSRNVKRRADGQSEEVR